MTVCYLEIDDEITGAIARIRAVKDHEAIIVVPPGSRIATSRINFKLLAREGNERRLNIVAVSDEPSARALAISAGLPAYDSISAAEAALATFRDQDRRLAERLGRQPAEESGTTGVTDDDEERTQVMPAQSVPHTIRPSASPASPAAPASAANRIRRSSRRPGEAAEVGQPTRRRIGLTPLVAAAVLLVLLAGIAYGAYLFLPTATITLQPLATALTPRPFIVVADPDVAVADVTAGVVPAQRLEVPLGVTDTFAATGVEAHETKATGTVRFRSENTLNEVAVAVGTIVSTADGVDFETTAPAIVPRADFATSTPGTIDVPVRAARTGVRGNVPAEAITELPAGLRGQLLSVRNPDPTDGGRRVEEAVVTQADFDAALIALDGKLEAALALALNDPATTPRGLTLFRVSAQTGNPVPDPPGLDVVGTVEPTFSVRLDSVATVTAVNEGLVDDLAAARLRSTLTATQHLVGDQVHTTRSEGTVVVETVTYEVSPAAMVYADPDRAALVAAVRGKSITEARPILARYGMVDISIWPEFVDRLPDQTSRISLVVVTPSASPSLRPSQLP